MSTISTTITQTVTLGSVNSYPTYASPLTITASGAVETGTTAAIYGPGTQAWTVVNFGLITNTSGMGGTYDGIALHGGGAVTNNFGGTITSETNVAILVSGAAGTVTNTGFIGGGQSGVALLAGGIVINQAGGTIGGNDYPFIGFVGVTGQYTIGTVTNAGLIVGADTGIRLWSGGAVANQASGTISGFNSGIDLRGTVGYVTNAGTIIATSGAAIHLYEGAVNNQPTGTIASPSIGIESFPNSVGVVTVINAGTISGGGGTYGGFGVYLHAGGTVTNQSGGSIIGTSDAGVYIKGSSGTVINAGTIVGTGTSSVGVALLAGGSLGNTGRIEGYNGVYINGGTGTVINDGTINATGTLLGLGVNLFAGGSLGNTGWIEGGFVAVATTGPFSTVSNSGTILSASSFFPAIDLGVGGGSIYNAGLIQGFAGVVVLGPGTVTNSSIILGTTLEGVNLNAGWVTNIGTALIEGADGVFVGHGIGINMVVNSAMIVGTAGPGYAGVRLAGGGTIVDSGTISGGSGTAIYFGGTGSNLLVLQAGYYLVGSVYGSGTATNTVELAGTVGAAVTASYNGLGLTNFKNLLFGGGGYSTLLVSNTTGTLGVTIAGFDAATEIIDLTGIGSNGTITNRNTDTDRITVTGSLGSLTLQFDSIDAINFSTTSDGSGGTELTPVCYCRGTQILTDRGEVAVEDLAVGDRVLTISGEAKPVKWVGHRAYDGRFVAGNRAMLPVRIAAGALADGVPVRDLCVSPGHALLIAGMLVRAENLVNGATITQDTAVERVEYFHVELEMHDVIIADGAPAESYIDCDNRGKFHNAADFARLYPDDERPHWQFCAPLLDWDSPEPNTIREALMTRAEKLGHKLDRDPDLHLVVDGAVIRPKAIEGRVYRFAIPSGSAAALLASRNVVPAEVEPRSRDLRRLGVPVERIVLCHGGLRIEAEHGYAGLEDGFHDDEATHRWTGSLARLPASWLRVFPAAFTLEVHLRPSTLPYRPPPAAAERRAAA